MSNIVITSEKPSYLFIEGFWIIPEGSYLIFKGVILFFRGVSMLFVAIKHNAGLPFVLINTALFYILALRQRQRCS